MSPSPMSPSSRTSGGGRGGGVTELESGDDLGYMEYYQCNNPQNPMRGLTIANARARARASERTTHPTSMTDAQ